MYGLGKDNIDNLYHVDRGNHAIRFDDSIAVISTLAGGNNAGPGNSGYLDGVGAVALFKNPTNIAVSLLSSDYTLVFVADTGNNVIRQIKCIDGTVHLTIFKF